MKNKKKKQAENTPEKDVEISEESAPCEQSESACENAVEQKIQPAEEKTASEQLSEQAASEQTASEQADGEPLGAPKVYSDKVLTKAQKRKRTVIRWILINIAIVLMAVSVYFFQMQYNFVLGGVGGISIMLAEVIPVDWLTPAVIMVFINVFLLIFGFIILGRDCTFKTVYCCILYTGLIFLFEKVIPLEKPVTAEWVLDEAGQIVVIDGVKQFTGQPFLELCYAILLFGLGGAILFNCGASSGGTDIIALILKKYTKINVGVSLLIVDLIVTSVSIFTTSDVSITLYSFLGLFARTFLLDGIIESFGKTKYITVITQKPDEIANYILNVIQHGLTMYDAEGGYTHEKKKILITICKRGEALKLKYKVKSFDPEAFVIITDANEILGKGFNSGF